MSEIDYSIIKNNYFVTPKELKTEYNKSIDLGECTLNLLNMFKKIAERFSIGNYSYVNKIDFNACVNYAVSEAYFKWNKFDEEKSTNIFSFYTTMLSNDMKIHYKQLTRGKELNISLESLFSNIEK
ncbi:hypothetical protein M0Q97_03525 [Candidatus Dojkabacteria bacterium]|jgi:hypothetical protein|nr:hypothetical protein [Candidatus Dojkabacteria bacterium]